MTESDPASLRRRATASLIDGILGLVAYGGVGVVASVALWQRGSSRDVGKMVASPAYQRTQAVVVPVVRVALRNVRTPGQRLLCVRRVEAGTGGPISLRRAAARMVFVHAWGLALTRALAPMRERQRAMGEMEQAARREARERHPGDHKAQVQAMVEIVAASDLRAEPRWVSAALPVAIEATPWWFTERRQSLSDWVAGIVVVRD